MQHQSILETPIAFLKGVGPMKAELLQKELSIATYSDLLFHFPYRYLDKSRITDIASLSLENDYVQVMGKLIGLDLLGEGVSKRLVGTLQDTTGSMELVWFQGIGWVQKQLELGNLYVVFAKPGFYNGKAQFSHPEIEVYNPNKRNDEQQGLQPIYPSTEKLKARGLGGKQFAALTKSLFQCLKPSDLEEIFPDWMLETHNLMYRYDALTNIHFPSSVLQNKLAIVRLKFEELFLAQFRMALARAHRQKSHNGVVFSKVGDYFNTFYSNHLPFALTGAQKRVLREIRGDTLSGSQMNRLLQGDVGSGKTIVAMLSMLLAADNGFQSCLMAPTEILAQQHFLGISESFSKIGLKVGFLSGSTKGKQRKEVLSAILDGSVGFLIGTHALIEDAVQFKQLGLVIVDEQHRFGVEQRAKLWKKANIPPHILVMTATPIPRTLAMTLYGDLESSIIDELPPGRKPIATYHRFEMARASVMTFVREEIAKGRQAYIIYPLIEESEKLSYEDLMQGYEQVKAYFPEPKYQISMLHGKQSKELKQTNMERFVKGETHIMVATTVVEVGVNVPNASVMVIESAEKFGLSQLHQLRGRVGRGSEKSYCILMTGSSIGNDAKERIATMCSTNDGFKIAEKDLELRGPGDIEGTKQSGTLEFKIASLVEDGELIGLAKSTAELLIQKDPRLVFAEHASLKSFLVRQKDKFVWGKIS